MQENCAIPSLPGVRKVSTLLHEGADKRNSVRTIAEEVPVSLVYKGISHVVMMASPADLEEFGLGFSLSEGIIQSPEELTFIDVMDTDQGYIISMDIPNERYKPISKRKRHMAGRTGCGLCGVESLDEARPKLETVTSDLATDVTAIYKAFDTLHPHQPGKQATGAIHAAAWADETGDIKLVREDVGRHNALDKLIGAMGREGYDFADGFCLITSRCSYEMVQKAVFMNMPVLAAISAPTTLAVDMAESAGLTLAALARHETVTLFTHPQRIREVLT